MAVRQIDGGSELINLLHGFGHCTSHSSVLRLDTALAEKTLKNDEELPKDVINGEMPTLVIDNADFGEETKDQTHIMNMILLQNPRSEVPEVAPDSPMKRTFRKSMQAPEVDIQEYSLTKKKSPDFSSLVKDGLSSTSITNFGDAQAKDFLYILTKYFYGESTVPPYEWTGYNSQFCSPRKPTRIHYLPIIDASPTEYSTIYTTMKKALKMKDEINTPYITMVCDEAIYAKVT